MRARHQHHTGAQGQEGLIGDPQEAHRPRGYEPRQQSRAQDLGQGGSPRAAMNRRNTAPAAALSAINARLKGRASPKMTPRAAAPAPARAAKRKVDAGGSRAIAFSAAAAPLTSSRPAETRSSTSIVFMTLFMSTPTGGPATGTICALDS